MYVWCRTFGKGERWPNPPATGWEVPTTVDGDTGPSLEWLKVELVPPEEEMEDSDN